MGDALPCPGQGGQELSCLLPCHRSQVPETVSPGSTLVTLRCTDSSGAEGSLHYALEGSPASHSRFRMEGPQLQVSRTTGSTRVAGEPGPGRAQWDIGDPLTCAIMLGPRPGLPGTLCSQGLTTPQPCSLLLPQHHSFEGYPGFMEHPSFAGHLDSA